MKITPSKGFLLISAYEMKETKNGFLIIPGEEKKKSYFKVEVGSETYPNGCIVMPNPYKGKYQIEETLFLIDEKDVIALIEFEGI